MKNEELLRRLRALRSEIEPTQDLWPEIEKAVEHDLDAAANRALESDSGEEPVERSAARIYVLRAVAVAASIVGIASVLLLVQRSNSPRNAWSVRLVEGTVSSTSALRKGQRLETDSTTRYVATTDIGEVLVERNTNVQLVELTPDRQVLSLERGEIYARIDAPPRVFVVETPSVTAIDLGCEYRLAVDGNGVGELNVVSGWVALEYEGREWYVPAGASARIRGIGGPAPPVFDDATDRFHEAVLKLFAASGEPRLEAEATALGVLLEEARRFDSLTLWHIAADAGAEQRGEIYDTLLRTSALPEGLSRQDFVNRVPASMDWLRIHLEESVWFRPELFFDSNLDLPFETDRNKKKKRKPAVPERVTR